MSGGRQKQQTFSPSRRSPKDVKKFAPPPADWPAWFPLHYDYLARKAKAQRAKRRVRALVSRFARAKLLQDRVRRACWRLAPRYDSFLSERRTATYKFWQWIAWQARLGDPDAMLVYRAGWTAGWAAERREQNKKADAAIRDRLENGFTWPGGVVGDRHIAPFVHRGLVSEQHAILQLFVASTRRCHALRVGQDKATCIRPEAKLLGLDEPYVETNKRMRRVLRVDVDRDFASLQDLREEIALLNVPAPNIAVGHQAPDGRILRPHLIWLIQNPVAFTDKARPAPWRLFLAVLNALTAELLPLGADVGALSNACRHKNPVSPLWDRHIIAERPYTLEELRAALPLNAAKEKLAAQRSVDAGPVTRLPRDHPDPEIVAESNRLFIELATMARKRIAWHRDEGNGSKQELIDELTERALRLVPGGTKAEATAMRVATSVGEWTWTNYRRAEPKRPPSLDEIRARQAEAGRRTAEGRSAQTRSRLLAAARDHLARTGRCPTQAELAKAAGRSVDTVSRHWKAILADLQATPQTLPLDVKKGSDVMRHDTPGRSTSSVWEGLSGRSGASNPDQTAPRLEAHVPEQCELTSRNSNLSRISRCLDEVYAAYKFQAAARPVGSFMEDRDAGQGSRPQAWCRRRPPR